MNCWSGALYGSGWYWDNVNGSIHLMDSSAAANGVGPYGWANYGNVDCAEPGDVTGYPDRPVSAQTQWTLLGYIQHAMVVTQVTGTSGSRSLSDIFIAAHNNPTNSAYEPLVQYAPGHSTEMCWSTARILGGQYDTAQ